ncbi:MAG: hypothetical protein HY342_11545 [Candidatus Lambdaproteobacteria bacterium]|nr:hypothetical protein [Candidatus Lambdaproteobacteria bacterium]
MGTLLPPPEHVTLWQQDTQALLAWDAPAGAGDFGDVIGYSLRIERRALDCLACPPRDARNVELDGASMAAARSGGRYLYPFPIGETRALWVASVAARFAAGASLPAEPVTLEAPERLPRQELEAIWLPGDRPVLRLAWPPLRDRIVQVLGKEGHPVARELFFRANVYQRDAGGAWPLRPLNGSPISNGQWLINFIVRDPPPLEYALRLVDAAGNEGPLSSPVPLPRREPAQ